MTLAQWRKNLRTLVSRRANVGMTLTLDGKKHYCIDIEPSSYGTRYVFDSGMRWTIDNICKNIEKCARDGNDWDI